MLLNERYPFERLLRRNYSFISLREKRTLTLHIEDAHPVHDLIQRLESSRNVLGLVKTLRLDDRQVPHPMPLSSREYVTLLRLLPCCVKFEFEDIVIDGSRSDIIKAMKEFDVPKRRLASLKIKFGVAFTSSVRHDLLNVLLTPFAKLDELEVQLHSSHLPQSVESFVLPKGSTFDKCLATMEGSDTPAES